MFDRKQTHRISNRAAVFRATRFTLAEAEAEAAAVHSSRRARRRKASSREAKAREMGTGISRREKQQHKTLGTKKKHTAQQTDIRWLAGCCCCGIGVSKVQRRQHQHQHQQSMVVSVERPLRRRRPAKNLQQQRNEETHALILAIP